MWDFNPNALQIGELVTGGDVIGHVRENTLF
jgi:vacuolar-type H+-ATPase catalytic subunit A/Vma1